MSAKPPSFHPNPSSRGNVHIYIDNSNLWIQGQRTYAEKKKLKVQWDPTWRFDVGRLKQVLLENSQLQADERSFDPMVNLYGSTPPPVDTVWMAIESHNVKVSTFARSSWTGREKLVDHQISVDSVAQAADAFYSQIPSTFMIVSGDGDLFAAAMKIQENYRFPVHVWSWKNCLSSIYTEQPLVRVHFLDDYLEKIGFRETTFRIDRNTINPHSVVVLDPLPKADKIEEFVSRLEIPVYRYACKDQRPEACSKDLVIIPAFAHGMKYEDLESFYRTAKEQLEKHGLSVLSYLEYRSFGTSGRVELELSNRFSELPAGEFPSGAWDRDDDDGSGGGGGKHDVDGSGDDNDGWVDVNRQSEQQRKYLKKAEQNLRKRCDWRLYCIRGVTCKYGHTEAEEKHFNTYGPKKAIRYNKCPNADCTLGKKCRYAHSDQDLFCPTCGKTGAGHEMVQCPESDRNKRPS